MSTIDVIITAILPSIVVTAPDTKVTNEADTNNIDDISTNIQSINHGGHTPGGAFLAYPTAPPLAVTPHESPRRFPSHTE